MRRGRVRTAAFAVSSSRSRAAKRSSVPSNAVVLLLTRAEKKGGEGRGGDEGLCWNEERLYEKHV